MKRLLPFAVLLIAAACSDGAAPFAPTTESSVLLASRIAAANASNASKVDVCHVDGKGNYRIINVSENAKQAHLDHGDIEPVDGSCSEEEVSFAFVGLPTQVAGVLSWTVTGTTSAVSFVVQHQLPSDPTAPPGTPGAWTENDETVTGIAPGTFYSTIAYGSGTFRIVATLANGDVVTSGELAPW